MHALATALADLIISHCVEAEYTFAALAKGMGEAQGIHPSGQVQVLEEVHDQQIVSIPIGMYVQNGIRLVDPQVGKQVQTKMRAPHRDHGGVDLHRGDRGHNEEFIPQDPRNASSPQTQQQNVRGWSFLQFDLGEDVLPYAVQAPEGLVPVGTVQYQAPGFVSGLQGAETSLRLRSADRP